MLKNLCHRSLFELSSFLFGYLTRSVFITFDNSSQHMLQHYYIIYINTTILNENFNAKFLRLNFIDRGFKPEKRQLVFKFVNNFLIFVPTKSVMKIENSEVKICIFFLNTISEFRP